MYLIITTLLNIYCEPDTVLKRWIIPVFKAVSVRWRTPMQGEIILNHEVTAMMYTTEVLRRGTQGSLRAWYMLAQAHTHIHTHTYTHACMFLRAGDMAGTIGSQP
jgi:hypothetical protein